MDKMTIEVFLANVHKTVSDLFTKYYVDKEQLSLYEQKLLNDIQTLIIHSRYDEIIRQHFSTK